ncbi:MAG TPA: lamin tail domain-containing protein [Kineosporiaceae bacterium]|nr:lamin tail domain-containing protein [Kineosporiaceae bacterium]
MRIKKLSITLLATLSLIASTAAIAAPASAASKIHIVKVRFDSAGSDAPVTNPKLNDEFVVIKNTDTVDRSLTGWTIVDESSHRYTFGETTIKAGATLKVRTGRGDDTAKNKYQDRGYYVWNNTSDTAYLRNTRGRGGDTCSWETSDPGSTKVC